MKYLILGSTSFAGSSFVDYLLEQGQQVLGVSRSLEPHVVMQPYANNPNKNAFKFIQCDLNNNLDQLIDLIKLHKPSVIVDFAGQGMVAESWNDPAQWYQTNIVSKVKLHHFLKDCDFLEKYVRVSTPEVYGDADEVLSETQTLNPSTPYAVSHAAIDMSLLAFNKQYQFPVILTRFANFYGPCQQLYRIVPRTIIFSMLNRKLPLHGGGTSQRMFIYGKDVASGIYKALEKGQIGQTYHFTNGPLVSIRGLVESICDLMGISFDAFVENSQDRPGKDSKYEMNADRAQKELGWKPEFTLEKGLEQTIQWVRRHINDIQNLSLQYIHKP